MRYKIFLLMLTLFMVLCGCGQVGIPSNNTAPKEFKQSPKPDLSVEKLDFERKDTEENILDKDTHLVGFDQNNYFFLYACGKDWIFATGSEQNKKPVPIYHIPKSNDIFFEEVYNNNLLIGTGYWEGDTTCHYELFSISPKKNKETVFECVSRGYPTASLVDHYVVINLAEQQGNLYTSKLLAIDLVTKEVTTIEVSKYSIVDNLYNGTFIINAGGWKNGFCYEKVKMDKESMQEDLSGKSAIYYYSFAEKKSEKLTDYPKKVYYISGSKDCYVTSDYLLQSSENSGKIWVKEKGGYKSYEIPGIVTGEDIRRTYRLSDNTILINNDDYYFIYNLANKTYYAEKYEFKSNSPENYVSLSIRACGNQFAYIEPNKNELILHKFTLKTH